MRHPSFPHHFKDGVARGRRLTMGFNRREDRIDFGVLGRFKHGDASSCGRKRRVGIREQARPKHEPPAGPLHAGTFGPNELDNTFGPEVKFIKAPMP